MDAKLGVRTAGLAAAIALPGCASTGLSPGQGVSCPAEVHAAASYLPVAARSAAVEQSAGDALSGPSADGSSCSSCHEDPHASLRATPREVPPTAREAALAEVSSFGAIGLLAAVSFDPQASDAAWGQPAPSRGGLREAARLYDITFAAPRDVEGLGLAVEARAERSVLSTVTTTSSVNRVHAVSRTTQPVPGHLPRLTAHG